ncbi:hypothetical protein QXB71_003585 [Vibrio cholerae]|mgnify:CR=1 FL=1|nr:hypothetical protein [Vibrio cholerae]EJL6709996.1 hypothetical protein [Vibrio cholerae]ELO1828329.1 hypothetical protein [Vibrio cholerae]
MDLQLIRALAQSMGVSEKDVLMLAQGVASDLQADRVDGLFVVADEKTQCEFVQAYAAHQVKKFRNFHTTYLTNPSARHSFQESVHALIAAKN